MGMSTIAAQPRIIGRMAPVRVTAPTRTTPSSRATLPRTQVPARAATPSAAPAGRLTLTRRGRVVVALLGLLLAVAGVMGGRAVADGPQQATEVQTYSVQSGDTMWSIAQGVAQPGEDVRDVVIRLQRLNDLGDSSLLAGQVLMLPVTD